LAEILAPHLKKKIESYKYRVPGTENVNSKTPKAEAALKKKVTESNVTKHAFDLITQKPFVVVKKSILKKYPKAKVSYLLKKEFKNLAKENYDFLLKVEIPIEKEGVWEVAKKLERTAGVVEVDPDLTLKAGIIDDDTFEDFSPNDVLESFGAPKGSNKDKVEKQNKGLVPNWNHDNVRFPQAIAQARKNGDFNGKTTIKIAQIDTGFTHHPKIDTMNKDDGYDYMDSDDYAFDENSITFPLKQPGHGTRTASALIGGPTQLAKDFNFGVFPYVNYVPFRVFDSVIILRPKIAEHVANVVMQAIKEKYDIAVMSMGGYGRSVWRVAAKAAYDNGLIWVCAAGNKVRLPNFVVRPASYPGTIAAAASNYKDLPWKGSMRGPTVDITAPGENIYVPSFDNKGNAIFRYGSGTSFAVPHVAAAAALWLHINKEKIKQKYGTGYKDKWKKVEAFRQLLIKSARVPVGGWNDRKMGAGILNVEELITLPLPDIKPEHHAYQNASFKNHLKKYKQQKNQLRQKELLHYVWNGELTLAEEGDSLSILSPDAKSYLEEMKELGVAGLESLALEGAGEPGDILRSRLLGEIEGWDR